MSADAEIRLRVATYNVHGCVGTDRRYAPERVAKVISLNADGIALQEVDDRTPRCEGLGQFARLCRLTGLHGVAGPTLRCRRGHYGNAILSRFPVEAVRRIDLSVPRREPRGALDVEVVLGDGERVRVLATHLGLRARERKRQVDRLMDHLRQPRHHGYPTVLMGDFNEWLSVEGPRLKHLSERFASRLAGPSFPSWFPVFSLDRIYALPAPDRAEAEVHRSRTARTASDHFPVMASLAWSRAAGAAGRHRASAPAGAPHGCA